MMEIPSSSGKKGADNYRAVSGRPTITALDPIGLSNPTEQVSSPLLPEDEDRCILRSIVIS
jgi:hypothetical protein